MIKSCEKKRGHMSFSSINNFYFENLERLYCRKPEENVEKIENHNAYFYSLRDEFYFKFLSQALIDRGHVNSAITKEERLCEIFFTLLSGISPTLEIFEKLGKHIPHFLAEGAHLGKDFLELGHQGMELFHSGKGKSYIPDTHFDESLVFISQIAGQLAFRFQEEISTLTTKECRELGQQHYKQIISLLEKHLEEHSTPSLEDLITEIIDLIDPNPKEEIQKMISDYIIERHDRWIRSANNTREIFLGKFLYDLKKGTDLSDLIHRITECVLFKDYSFSEKGQSIKDMNPFICLENPIIKCQEIAKAYSRFNKLAKEQTNHELHHKVAFNNPFWTNTFFTSHVTMQQLSKKIALCLMRWKIMQNVGVELKKYKPINLKAFKDLPTERSKAVRTTYDEFELKNKKPSKFREDECNRLLVLKRHKCSEIEKKLMWDYFHPELEFEHLSKRFNDYLFQGQLSDSNRLWIAMNAGVTFKQTHDLIKKKKEKDKFRDLWVDSEILEPVVELLDLPL